MSWIARQVIDFVWVFREIEELLVRRPLIEVMNVLPTLGSQAFATWNVIFVRLESRRAKIMLVEKVPGPVLRVASQQRDQAPPLHSGGYLYTSKIEQCRPVVNVQSQLGHSFTPARLRSARVIDNEW